MMAILITLLPTTRPDHSPATPTSSPTSDSLEAAVIIFQGFDFSTRMCRANFKVKEACERIWYQSLSLSLHLSVSLYPSIQFYPSICLTVSPSMYLNHYESVSYLSSYGAWLCMASIFDHLGTTYPNCPTQCPGLELSHCWSRWRWLCSQTLGLRLVKAVKVCGLEN